MSKSAKTAFYGLGGITSLSVLSGALFLGITLFTGPSVSKLNSTDGPCG
jgi:hypothetical protein